MSSEPPVSESSSIEFATISQQILFSQSIEAQPSTSQDESYLQPIPTESSTTPQPTPISDSIGLESSTLQDISDIFEPDVSDNNIVTQDVNTSTDSVAGNNEVICIFCDRKKKKVRSRMLLLHAADVHQFRASIKPNIENYEEYKDFANKLDNFSGLKIYYHTECRVDFNNTVSSLKATRSKTDWHYHQEYHQIVFNEISTIINEDVIKKGRCFLLIYLHEIYIDSFSSKFFIYKKIVLPYNKQ